MEHTLLFNNEVVGSHGRGEDSGHNSNGEQHIRYICCQRSEDILIIILLL